jgi:DNA (cytosine-5)-methyltransferase 1
VKYLSLFSGYGGFELGIQQAYDELCNKETGRQGQEENIPKQGDRESMCEPNIRLHPTCIGFSEIDKYATQIYKKHFNHKEYGDIKTINPAELPDFELLVGGFPCQAFSIAGKRAGFEDTRGTLIYDVFRIIKEKHPKLVLLENVKGLLSHDNGRTFKTIITSLAELGYAVEWQVLNAKNFGVPQNRERVFIIGHLGGFGGRQVFPIGEGNPETIECGVNTGTLTSRYPMSQREGTYIEENGNKKGKIKQIIGGSQGNRVYDISGISTTLASQAGGLGAKTGLYAIPVLTPDRINKRQNGRRFKKDGDPSFTLTGQDKHGIMTGHCLDKPKIRRLTPTECERLMGLPDGWTEGVSDTQRYKLCGNGVVVNVVQEIIKRLL